MSELGITSHQLRFRTSIGMPDACNLDAIFQRLFEVLSTQYANDSHLLNSVNVFININRFSDKVVLSHDVRSIVVKNCITLSLKEVTSLNVSWTFEDEEFAQSVLTVSKQVLKEFENK
jgi:hypothetical protein